MIKIYLVNLKIKYHSEINHQITAWSGSFALKMIYDYFKKIGLDFERKSKKPFFIEPLVYNDKYILTGFYRKDKGELSKVSQPFEMKNSYIFEIRVYFIDNEILNKFLKACCKEDFLKEPSGIFITDSIHIQEKEIPDVSFHDEGKWHTFEFKVNYLTPTNFIFHGKQLTFPSPIRFIYSIASYHSSIYKKNYKEKLEQNILKEIDISDAKIRKILVDIGEGRKVPCFIGEATYVVNIKEGNLNALSNLLLSAEILGVGKSRALGFGRIKVNLH